MVSYIAPKQAADQNWRLLAATYFYPVSSITAAGKETTYAKIGSATVTKTRDKSLLLVKGGGILKVSNFVGGFSVNVDGVDKRITMTNLMSYVSTYGVCTFDGLPVGAHTVALRLYITPSSGGNATATTAEYQYYPFEVYEVY